MFYSGGPPGANLDYFDVPALKSNIDPPTNIPPYSASLVLQVVLFPFAGVKRKRNTNSKCSVNGMSLGIT